MTASPKRWAWSCAAPLTRELYSQNLGIRLLCPVDQVIRYSATYVVYHDQDRSTRNGYIDMRNACITLEHRLNHHDRLDCKGPRRAVSYRFLSFT
jgi:hypothetical protein